jgi:hypothetical protein
MGIEGSTVSSSKGCLPILLICVCGRFTETVMPTVHQCKSCIGPAMPDIKACVVFFSKLKLPNLCLGLLHVSIHQRKMLYFLHGNHS